jgi:cytochrome P450
VKRRVSAVVTHQRQREARGEYKNDSLEKAIYPTILADPEVPESEKDLLRLQDDAIFLMVAGTDLPAQALAITMFHILNNPKVYQKLKEELFSGIPDINTTPTLEELERLPYLVSWL